MTQRDLENVKEKLLLLKEELEKKISDTNNSNEISDRADDLDSANRMIEEVMGSALTSSTGKNLALVNEALQKIENQTYGICQECGKNIAPQRLEMRPFAEYCIKCKTALEEAGEI